MNQAAAEVYKTQAIMTAPPAKLVAMCYERTIQALRDSIRAIEAGDIQARFNHATRAANIIAHLWGTLDLERGGEVARNLANLYGFAMKRLPDINLRNDTDAAREIIDLLMPLARSWNELANRGERMPAAGPITGAAAPRPMALRAPGNLGQAQPARSGGIKISI